MRMMRRLTASRHLRTLRRAEQASAKDIEDAKAQLVASGASIVPEMAELLADPLAGPHARAVIEKLLARGALPEILDRIENSNALVARTLGEIVCEAEKVDATAALERLEEPDGPRHIYERILLAHGTSLPLRKLVQRLEEDESGTREIVFRVLESHASSSIVPHLSKLVTAADTWLKLHALKLLSRFPGGSAHEPAIVALSDASANVRLQAVDTLRSLAAQESIPALCHALRDTDLKVHTAAIDALTDIGDVSAVPHLVDVLKDESEYARRGAVEVLNEVATTDAIKDLVLALRDADWWVRVRAADALGSLGGARVVEALLDLLDTGDEFIRRYAVEILITVHDARCVEPLIAALNDADWWVRERSIDALARIGDARAVDPLIDLMGRDAEAATLCARALATLGNERAVAPLAELATTGSTEVAAEAIQALNTIARGEISPEARTLVRETLASLGAGRTRPGGTRARGSLGIDVDRVPASGPLPAGTTEDVDPSPPPSPPGIADTMRAVRPDEISPSSSSAASPASTDPPASPATPGSRPAAGSGPSGSTPINVLHLEPGEVLGGRYRVIRKIGSGGFGSVYLVEDTTVSDELILKILSPHICSDETVIRRFVHELKYTRRITHKNVIRLFDFLELGGVHAISMEHFAGMDLARMLRAEGSLDASRTLAISRQIVEGLEAAHAEGIIHRDIKPPNILVADDDTVKIVDFGLASMAQNAGSQLTKSGMIIGTPQYIAPEQITGDPTDARTDFYSLGVMMYEMLSGVQPFRGETAVNILFQHLEADVDPLAKAVPGVPAALSDLVAACMSKTPDGRPESAGALLVRIDEVSAVANAGPDDHGAD